MLNRSHSVGFRVSITRQGTNLNMGASLEQAVPAIFIWVENDRKKTRGLTESLDSFLLGVSSSGSFDGMSSGRASVLSSICISLSSSLSSSIVSKSGRSKNISDCGIWETFWVRQPLIWEWRVMLRIWATGVLLSSERDILIRGPDLTADDFLLQDINKSWCIINKRAKRWR